MSPAELADVAVVLVLGLAAVGVGGWIATTVFTRIDRSAPARPGDPSIVAAGKILRGGSWIGALERLAVYVALMAGWPEGIAVALAMKGLARYPELQAKTSAAAERFIIGTFVSVIWACACAGLSRWLLTLW